MMNRKDSCSSDITGLKVLCVHTYSIGQSTWANTHKHTHTQKYKAELLPFMAAGGRDMRRAVLISSSQLASPVICTTHTHRKEKCPPINNAGRRVQSCRYLYPALLKKEGQRARERASKLKTFNCFQLNNNNNVIMCCINNNAFITHFLTDCILPPLRK